METSAPPAILDSLTDTELTQLSLIVYRSTMRLYAKVQELQADAAALLADMEDTPAAKMHLPAYQNLKAELEANHATRGPLLAAAREQGELHSEITAISVSRARY